MNYYFLPGTGIYGGIKVGYRFADLLNELGAPAAVVTPDGRAPDWFRSSAPTLREADALLRLTAADTILFSLPHDHARLAALPARKVFHCQGTDPLIDPILADPAVTILTCWPQAAAYVRRRADRPSVEVGISIDPVFEYDGRPKMPATVAFMPRRGQALAEACRQANPHLRAVPIDGLPERAVAAVMRRAEYYLATAVNEWFGLPALEAMAAGCVVVSVPPLGGMDYLADGANAVLAEPAGLAAALAAISAPDAAARRARLRDHARATASAYRPGMQRKTVAALLEKELCFLRR